jgi:prepilin peptidase CpaA
MVSFILVSIMVAAALITDLKARRIPNTLTFGGTILGIIINTFQSGWGGLADSLLGFVVGVGILLIPFLMGGIGAGDVKLLGAIGALMGVHFVFYTTLWAAVAGGLLSLIYLLLHHKILYMWMYTRTTSGKFMPYGVAIFVGTLVELSRVNGWIG